MIYSVYEMGKILSALKKEEFIVCGLMQWRRYKELNYKWLVYMKEPDFAY